MMTASFGDNHLSASTMVTNRGWSIAGMPSFLGPPEKISE
jgi:hypothetical protein